MKRNWNIKLANCDFHGQCFTW